MKAERNIKQVCDALIHLKGIKAETAVASIVASGYDREAFMVSAQHFFSREYTKDISEASLFEDEWDRSLVQLQLSRPGFYDMLPEGLFFQPGNSEYSNNTGVTEMAALYRHNKQKEKGIRKFFQPFEHAGFYQLLQLEEEERELLLGLEKNLLHQHFRRFWNLPEELNNRITAYFILLIPYAHRICGDIELMQECLELLLEEEIEITYTAPGLTAVETEMENRLGEQLLGENMVCGDSFMEEYPAFKYAIGPLTHTRITDYLPGGRGDVVINTFSRFFLPAEAVSETEIEIGQTFTGMILDPQKEPVLGYSSLLTI